MKNSSDKEFSEFNNWLVTFSDYTNRDEYQLNQNYIYTNEIEAFMGRKCFFVFSDDINNKQLRRFLVLLLKDRVLIFHIAHHYNGAEGLLINSMREPNVGDVEVLSEILISTEKMLHKEQQDEQNKILTSEIDVLLDNFLNVRPQKIKRLQLKIDFAKAAIKYSSDNKVENYKEGDELLSLYYSTAEIEKQKQNALHDRIHMVWQRQNIANFSKNHTLKDTVCPACLNERNVFESPIGFIEPHFSKKRLCYFCWGKEQHPLYDYLNMELNQFMQHLEQMLNEKKIYFNLLERTFSERTRFKSYVIEFSSRYNIMPSVTEVYNMIFIVLTMREQRNNDNKEFNSKTIADILLTLKSPYNRIIFLDSIMPLFNKGFVLLPNFNDDEYSLSELAEKYEAAEEILNIVGDIYNQLTVPRINTNIIHSLKLKFEAISKDLVKGYEDVYNMAEQLFYILYYMNHTIMEFEDYHINDGIPTNEVVRFCESLEFSPFKTQKVTDNTVRNWIKRGELRGKKQGRTYQVEKSDLIEFFKASRTSK